MSTPIVYLQSLLLAIGYLALVGSFVYIVLTLIRLSFVDHHPAYGSEAINNRIFIRLLMHKQYTQPDDFDQSDQVNGSHACTRSSEVNRKLR